jgi:hypothetical protein
VALATSEELPELTEEDHRLVRALGERGAKAIPVVWTSKSVVWGRFDAIVVRSCWDYHLRQRCFIDWIGGLERSAARLWNPPAVLRWNADKRYLRDLDERGVPVVRTRWVEPGDRTSLRSILEESGWDDAVVKPTISASAFNTWWTTRRRARADEERFRSMDGTVMVQPFLKEIVTAGEWSLVFLRGRFSHSVLKRVHPGDFRVQAEFGGTVERLDPLPGMLNTARAALRCIPGEWLYARVDGCQVEDRFLVMELELIEPALFLADAEGAAERFAGDITAVIGRGHCPAMERPT